MNRFVPRALILFGCLALGMAAYDEHRGIASAGNRGVAVMLPKIKRDEDPKLFRSVMTYEWLFGTFWICAGLVTSGILRRADKIDPLSATFVGRDALEELDATLDKEQRQRDNQGNNHSGKW